MAKRRKLAPKKTPTKVKTEPANQELVTQYVEHQLMMTGPLPHPGLLQAYEEAVPGSSERIIKMAEKEQDQRHSESNRIVDGLVKESSRGQWISGLVSGGAIICGTVAVALGHDVAGAAIAIVVPGALVARSFIAKIRGKDASAAVGTNNADDRQMDLFDPKRRERDS